MKNAMNPLKVLVVDDSLLMQRVLTDILQSDPQLSVVGTARNGEEALARIPAVHPDVVTLDVEMPVMNGLEATRVIMSTNPVPIVIVTASRNAQETKMTMDALAAGALTLIEKPKGMIATSGNQSITEMVTIVRLMAGVKVVTRMIMPVIKESVRVEAEICKGDFITPHGISIIAIGVSTGGPPVLKEIFSQLGRDFPVPIIVVQHIAAGFIKGMVDWLAGILSIRVKTGCDGERLQGGTIYFAPDGQHLIIDKAGIIRLKEKLNDNICPSVARLFGSVLTSFGRQTLAIMLTGMGDDGAREMKLLHDAGATTIAQHQESALIFGMPGEAVKMKGVTCLLRTNEIAGLLNKIEFDHKKSEIN